MDYPESAKTKDHLQSLQSHLSQQLKAGQTDATKTWEE